MDELGFAVDLVKRAGETLAENFRKDRELLGVRRSVKDITTKYDRLVDQEFNFHYLAPIRRPHLRKHANDLYGSWKFKISTLGSFILR